MALTAAGLAAAIKTQQDTHGPATDPAIQASANLDLATAIINYFKANTLVSVTVAVDPGSHIGTGTGAIS